MEQLNFAKAKLSAGKNVLGIWSIINSPIVSEIMATAGLDFQILDMEHGVFDTSSLDASIRACEAVGCSPLVRPATLSQTMIQTALDLGAHGVVVPQVVGKKDAEELVKCTHFAPRGRRGFNPFTRAGNYLPTPSGTPKIKNGFGLTSLIIENKTSYEELDQILEIPEIDMVYLGVYDMSVALGCMGDLENPKIQEFVNSAVLKILKAKKAAGLMVKSEAEMKKALDLGANFLVYGVDTFVLARAIREGVQGLTKVMK